MNTRLDAFNKNTIKILLIKTELRGDNLNYKIIGGLHDLFSLKFDRKFMKKRHTIQCVNNYVLYVHRSETPNIASETHTRRDDIVFFNNRTNYLQKKKKSRNLNRMSRCGTVRHDTTRHHATRHDTSRDDTRGDRTRRDKTRHNATRCHAISYILY